MMAPLIFILVSFAVVIYGLGGHGVRSAMAGFARFVGKLVALGAVLTFSVGAFLGIVYLIVRVCRYAWGSP